MTEPILYTLEPPFDHDGGHAYTAAAPAALVARLGPLRWDDPRLVLLEDGRALPTPTGSHEEIRKEGRGRYSFWGHEVHLSARDSSEVGANKRSYEVAELPPGDARDARHRDNVRLGFVGNINNIPFVLAEAAAALGYEVGLYPVHGGMLHDPASKLAGAEPPPWVHRVAGIDDGDLVAPAPAADALIEEVRANCDFVFLNGGFVPSLARRIDRPFGFLETGSDVTYYASFDAVSVISAGWTADYLRTPAGRDQLMALARTVALQRDAILGATVFTGFQPRGFIPEIDEVVDQLQLDDRLWTPCRVADLRRIHAQPFPGPPALRDELLVFSPVRVDFTGSWGDSALDAKGTDRLLEGFAGFLAAGGRGRLTMIRKGHDIAAAEAIIEQRGIGDQVELVAERPVAEYLDLVASAHLVCEAISPAGPAGVTHDAMATGRPVLGNLRPDVFGNLFGGEGYPGWHVETAADVTEALLDAHSLGDQLKMRGAEARAFAEERLSPDRFLEQELGTILDRALLPELCRSRGELI